MFDDKDDKKSPDTQNSVDSTSSDDAKSDEIKSGDAGAENPGAAVDSEENKNDASEGAKKAGKVIPFNEEAEFSVAVDEAKEAFSDAWAALKSAFGDFRKSMEPVKAGLNEIGRAISESVAELDQAMKNKNPEESSEEQNDSDSGDSADSGVSDAVEDSAGAAADEKASSDETEFAESSAGEDSKRPGFDFRGAFSREFEQYADSSLKEEDYTIDENGKRVVRIDPDFMKAHAAEMVPAVLQGVLGALFDAKYNEVKTGGSAPAETSSDEQAKKSESKYQVKFDFADAARKFIKKAEVVETATEQEASDLLASRAMVAEGVKIFEDKLNGKDVGDLEQRISDAVDQYSADDDENTLHFVDNDSEKEESASSAADDEVQEAAAEPVNGVAKCSPEDAEKAPDEIQAIDEKHRKILEISKEFEKAMHPDLDLNDK